MPSVSNSVSSLNSVSWTELNGSGLTSAQETTQIALVNNISNIHDELRENLSALNAIGTYSIAELASGGLLASSFSTQQEARNAAYADLSYRVTNGINFNGAQASYVDPSSPTGVSWVSFRLASYSSVSGGTSVLVGGHNFLQSTSQTPPSQAYPMPNSWNTYASPVISSNNSLLALAITQINASGGRQITASDRFTPQEWLGLLNRLEGQSYLEASKLQTKNGGGIKTHGGVWYANGEKLSYLDVTFAVRVNQLHVVNTTITDYLERIQDNNKKIKFANKISAIISADIPEGDETKNGLDWTSAIITAGFEAGLITPTYTSYEAAKTALNGANGKMVAYTNANGELAWARCHSSGSWVEYGNWLDRDYDLSTAIDWGYSIHDNATFDMSALKEIIPSSYEQFFTSSGRPHTSGKTFSQTDATSVTTELKSYTSGIDSDNQLIQTQLSQYNDKRTEVLDDLTSIVKGNSAALNDMARNLGAI